MPETLKYRPMVSGFLDLGTGLAAIAVVVGSGFVSQRVAVDVRALFSINAASFFAAGFARSSQGPRMSPWQVVRIVCPGLLGDAALIVNNGLHRLSIPVALTVSAVVAVMLGLVARRGLPTMPKRSALIAAGTAIATALAALYLMPRVAGLGSFEKRPASIASFSLDVNGKTITSKDLRGRVVVLAYFTSWCAPCVRELPHVQNAYRQFRSDPGVAFYAVDWGWEGETPEKGRAFLARHLLDLPMAFDPGEAARVLKVDAVPALFLVDANGAVRYVHVGYDESEASGMETGMRERILDLRNERQ